MLCRYVVLSRLGCLGLYMLHKWILLAYTPCTLEDLKWWQTRIIKLVSKPVFPKLDQIVLQILSMPTKRNNVVGWLDDWLFFKLPFLIWALGPSINHVDRFLNIYNLKLNLFLNLSILEKSNIQLIKIHILFWVIQ